LSEKKKKTAKQKNVPLILAIFMGVIFVSYILLQILSGLDVPVRTVLAQQQDFTDTVTLNGMFVRDEFVLSKSSDAAYDLLVADGEKVGKGQTYALLYSSAEYQGTSGRIAEIDGQIARLKRLENQRAESLQNFGEKNTVYTYLLEIADESEAQRFSRLAQNKEGLLGAILDREYAYNRDLSLHDEIVRLTAEHDELLKKRQGASPVRLTRSGYYGTTVDGYEEFFTLSYIDKTSPEQILLDMQTIENQAVDLTQVFGKVVENHVFYYVAPISAVDFARVSLGKTYTIAFKGEKELLVDMKLKKVSPMADGSVLGIFESIHNMSDVIGLRKYSGELILQKVRGLKVPKDAVRIIDGKEGVFCMIGNLAKFKRINRLFEQDNYYVCEVGTSSGNIMLYEQIIVRAKDLYDGKVIS